MALRRGTYVTMLTLRRGNVEAGLDIAMALRRGTYADMLTLVRGMLEPNRTLVAIAWKADRVLLFSGARIGRPPCSSRGQCGSSDDGAGHARDEPFLGSHCMEGRSGAVITQDLTRHGLKAWRIFGCAYW